MKSPRSIIRDEIQTLSAYQVPPSSGLIKLDAMESPYPLPHELQEGLSKVLAGIHFNRYPDPGATALKAAIRKSMGIPNELDLLIGNGSDEIIQIVATAVAKPGAALMSLEPAFVMFKMIAVFCGLKYVGVPLREDFSMDESATLKAIEAHRPAVTFIASPKTSSASPAS